MLTTVVTSPHDEISSRGTKSANENLNEQMYIVEKMVTKDCFDCNSF